jgi:hypothetical protein
MQHKIRLTAAWTDPETGTEYAPGDIALVHDWQLRLENAQGLAGKYSVRLGVPATPPQAAPAGRLARKAPSVPPEVESAPTGTVGADAADSVTAHDNE